MNLKKIEQQNARLRRYLDAHKKAKQGLSDIVTRIEIEEAKPKLESYLTVSKQWYEDREDYLESLLLWIEKRIRVITRNICTDGK